MNNDKSLIEEIKVNPNFYQLRQLVDSINNGWRKDWGNSGWAYEVCPNGSLMIFYTFLFFPGCIYFKSKELAEQLQKILGDNVIMKCINN